MPTYFQIQLYRGKGLTFREIGEIFGISRQRVHALFTGYDREIRQLSSYKEYQRHYKSHTINSKPKKLCKYC